MPTVNPGTSASATAPVSSSATQLLNLLKGATIYPASSGSTTTGFTLRTVDSQLVAINGINFAYETSGMPTGGVIGSISFRTSGGSEYMAWSELYVAVTNLNTAIAANDVPALSYMFFSGADTQNGSDFSDTLIGDSGNDTLIGNASADSIQGGDGNDSMNGGDGNDTLGGANGNDLLIGGLGDDTVLGGAGNDSIAGNEGNDILSGGDGSDDVAGGAGNDSLDGGLGNDTLVGGEGDDKIDGGANFDTISYATATTAITVDLKQGIATGQGNDTLIGLENVLSGSGNDTLTGGDSVTAVSIPDIIKPADLNISTYDYTANRYNALSLDGHFDRDVNFNISSSATIPHATVYASTFPGGGAEIYSFTTTQQNVAMTIDIDGTNGTDFYLYLYRMNDNGSLTSYLGYGGDSFGIDPGSTTSLDPYMQVNLSEPGRYAVLVYNSYYRGSSPYTLHVSIDDSGVVPLSLLDGAAGDDTINGGASDERIIGGSGSDTIKAGSGNDIIVVGDDEWGSTENVDGGFGRDTLLVNKQASDSFALKSGTASSIEEVRFSVSTLTIDAGLIGNGLSTDLTLRFANSGTTNLVLIDGANPVIDLSGWTTPGMESRDSIIMNGTSTVTSYIGSNGYDQVTYAAATVGISASLLNPTDNTGDAAGDTFHNIEQLTGSNLADRLGGDNATNWIYGLDGADNIFGLGGVDFIFGGNGDDILDGGVGGDYLDGGAGFDTVSYQFSSGPIERSLQNAGGSSDSAGDVLVSIEGMTGSAFADILSGNAFADDMLTGSGGSDWLVGLAGADSLFGGDGDDVLNGGSGADALRGDGGKDVAYYRDASAAVSLDLASGGTGGEASGDTFSGIENVWGSDFNDTILGDASSGQVYGFSGDDILSSAGGNDVLYGGDGVDRLNGGTGSDIFFFLNDLPADAGRIMRRG